MMALAGVELETLVSEPDALTTQPPWFILLRIRHFHFCLLVVCSFSTKRFKAVLLCDLYAARHSDDVKRKKKSVKLAWKKLAETHVHKIVSKQA